MVLHIPLLHVFCFVYYYGRSAKVLIPEGPSLRQSVLPICHDDLRMYKFCLHIFYISDQFNVIGCWTDLGIDQGEATQETDVLPIRPREQLVDVIL